MFNFRKSISWLGITTCLFAAQVASKTRSEQSVDQLLQSMQEIAADNDVAIKRASADSRALSALLDVESMIGGDLRPSSLSKARDVLRRLNEEPAFEPRSPDVAAAIAAAEAILLNPTGAVTEKIHHQSTEVVTRRARANVKNLTVRLFEAQRLSDGASANVQALHYGLAGAL